MAFQLLKLRTTVRRFVGSQDAPTMVEYALMLLFIALAVFGAVGALGTAVEGFFQSAVDGFS